MLAYAETAQVHTSPVAAARWDPGSRLPTCPTTLCRTCPDRRLVTENPARDGAKFANKFVAAQLSEIIALKDFARVCGGILQPVPAEFCTRPAGVSVTSRVE